MDHRSPSVQRARLIAATSSSESDPLLHSTARDAACTAADWQAAQDDLYGYVLMAVSTLGFSVMTLLVHLLGSTSVGYAVPSFFIVWCRSTVQLLAALVSLTCFTDIRAAIADVNAFRLQIIVVRGIVGTIGFLCLFEALSRLPLGDCST